MGFFYNILLFWMPHSSVISCFSKKWKHLFSTNIHTKNVNFLWNLRVLSKVFTPVFKKSEILFFQQNSVFLAKTTKYTQYFVVSIKKQQITLLSAHKILPPDVTFKENALTEPIQWHVEPVRDAQEDSSGSSFLAQEHRQLLGCGSWISVILAPISIRSCQPPKLENLNELILKFWALWIGCLHGPVRRVGW